MRRSKSVDEYIEDSEYWQDELRLLRKCLQATDLKETVKWGGPCYTYKGKRLEKILPMIADGIGLNDKYRNC